ncbi:unnamed protein product [Mytilus edulis]|uniref:Endonuclease n=1 Tax=Mytilus edulis TaxID=6550 RepID=A0A8S3QZ85_MYTED|nr:unnamed protein product [Mytilus edulis]
MRQELEALRNENLQKSYESEEMVKMRQELEALRNFKNLQMKNNAQHFTESKSDPVIRSPNSSYAETQQRSANSCNNTTLPETQQRSTNSCNNITLPETQQRPTYSYNTTTLPDTQQQQSYAYANMTIPEIQHRPNYSGTSTIMPEIQQRTDYEQYPNNSSVSNWLPRQQYGRPQQQYGRPQQQYHNIENSKIDNGRRNRVPFYNGRDPWSAYFMQFELIAEINRWDTDTKAIELVTALKDEAMVYASYLSPETKRSFFGLCAAMSNRFGDHGYPETYRQELHTLRKQGKENIHEYASRVEMLVRRSFPTIDVATHSTLSVEYMLRGLPDQSIAIELLTKRITSMTEAIHQVTLYETYKRGNKDRNIRQLSMQETVDLDEGEDDIEIRKVGGKRYVTEERLTQFERGITQSVGEIIQKEMTKFNKPNVNQGYRQNQQYNKDNRTKTRTTRCFNCNEEGHYIKDCKKPRKDITTRNGPCGDEFDALTHDLSLNLLFEGFDELQKSTPSDVIGSAEPSQAIEKNIVIDRVRAATITVPLVINKVETKAVIDTGAEVTVLSEELYSKIPKDMRPELKKATRNLVVAEAGKHMTTRGIAQIEMKLGNEIFTWPMYVAPIGDNVLLGCDLIDEKDITINCKRGLQLNGEWIECQTTRQIDGIARVRIKEAITIPANSEIIIAGEGYDTEGLSSRYSILEPVVEDSRKIMVARTLVDAHSCKVPVRLINLDEHPVKLRKNYLLGELHPVQDISEVIDLEEKKINRCGTSTNSCSIHSKHSVTLQDFLTDQGNKEAVKIPESWTESSDIRKISGAENDGNQMNKVDIQMMPDFLQDLYERSSKNLTDEVNRQKLRDLLLTNKDAFASNRTELGTCALVKHKIDTAGAAPIRQPLRRTPIRFEGEEMKNLKDQLDNGVIRPSTSPWASNVVLVRKKDQTVRWCLDYRFLNDLTIKCAYPIPRIDMCIDCLHSASVFSCFDLQSGYWQLQDPQGQLARWIESLAQYDFDIAVRPGIKHSNADALSRLDYNDQLCEHQKRDEYKEDCKCCKGLMEDWQKFKLEIDNIKELSSKIDHRKDTESKIRVTTRQQHYKNPGTNRTWLAKYTNQEMSVFQKEDENLKILHQWMSSGSIPDRDKAASLNPAVRRYWLNWQNVVLVEGVIFQKWILDEDGKYNLQLIVPAILQKEIMINCHDTPFSGHLGVAKTKDKMRQNFTWYGIGKDVTSHIKMCQICNRLKNSSRKPTAPLVDYRVGNPMDRIAIDIMGPLPITKNKNRYLLVIGDYFTRWMEVYPIPHQNADIIAEKLVQEFIARFGAPLEIHTDQGRNFESQLFAEVCKLLEISKTRTTAYHPSSNGMIERFNRTLAGMIKSFINSNANNWDLYINLLLSAYRSSPHPATGHTPNFMMLGREINISSSILFPFPKEKDYDNEDQYITRLRAKMMEVYSIARNHLKSYAERQKRDHDTRIFHSQYKVGSLVYKFDKNINKKFKSPWVGPYKVTKVLSPVVYEISYKNKIEIVHFDRLKSCTSD